MSSLDRGEKMRNRSLKTGKSNISGVFVALAVFFLFYLSTAPAWGRMEALSDNDMEAVTAQSGVSIALVNVQFDWAAGYVTLYDTDSDRSVDPDAGSISLEGMTLINGVAETLEAMTFDVYTLDDDTNPLDGQTFTIWQSPNLFQYLNLTIDNLVFCGQSVGLVEIDNFTTPQQYWTTGAHNSGMDFQYDLEMHLDRFGYTYNTSGTDDTFELIGIHLVGAFDDMSDFDILDDTTWNIPTDPSEWTYTGVFSIGDIDGGNPATLDIGTDASGQTVMQLEMPMSGSMRVENLNFGGNDFGPMAIDGLRVHRLTVTIPGGI